MQDGTTLSSAVAVTWVLLGIVISLLLPVAIRVLRAAKPKGLESTGATASLGQRFSSAWRKREGNKYLGLACASTFVAVVLVFLLDLEFHTVRDAALAGFAWESLRTSLLVGTVD